MTPTSKDLSLKYYPEPCLTKECVNITDEELSSEELVSISEVMIDIMVTYGGMGLAANQVGLNKNIFVMVDPDDSTKFITVINPEITKVGDKDESLMEGCLSTPGVSASIKRRDWVELKWKTLDGTEIHRKLVGIHARCALHEIDHLKGIMFFDHLGRTQRSLLLEKYRKRSKQETRRWRS